MIEFNVIELGLLDAQSDFRYQFYFTDIFYHPGITHITEPSARSAGAADDRASPEKRQPCSDG